MNRTLRFAWLLAVVVAVVVAMTATATASQGVAVDVGTIDVDEPLRAAERYSLPTVGVRNPGTEEADYQFFVQPAGEDVRAPDESWFHFSPAAFSLGPDEKRRVNITLDVPERAADGAYEALLTAQVVSPEEGASVGVAAAARLRFTIGEADGSRLPGWQWGLALLAGAGVTARALGRRHTRRTVEPTP